MLKWWLNQHCCFPWIIFDSTTPHLDAQHASRCSQDSSLRLASRGRWRDPRPTLLLEKLSNSVADLPWAKNDGLIYGIVFCLPKGIILYCLFGMSTSISCSSCECSTIRVKHLPHAPFIHPCVYVYILYTIWRILSSYVVESRIPRYVPG